MSIRGNLEIIKRNIPASVKLLAVSKTQPNELILEAYQAGHLFFGENRAQELAAKYESLPKDIEWHYIGHLQTNKIKYIASFVSLIHSVDTFSLLKEINKEAVKKNRIIPCLLQFHIATEETKFGLDLAEARSILSSEEFKTLKNISLHGLMGMATFTDDHELVRGEFKSLKSYFDSLKTEFFRHNEKFKEISMGMTDDHLIAIEEGSTIVRIGSAIFGKR